MSYPKLGEWRAPKRSSGRKCAVCGTAPAGIQFVEVSIFRGEDEAVACCKACQRNNRPTVLKAWLDGSGRVSA